MDRRPVDRHQSVPWLHTRLVSPAINDDALNVNKIVFGNQLRGDATQEEKKNKRCKNIGGGSCCKHA